MADKEAKEERPAAAPSADHGAKDSGEAKDGKPAKKGGGLLKSTPILLGAIMLIEAAALFAGFKFLGASPKQASAITPVEGEGGEAAAGGHEASAGGGGHEAPASGHEGAGGGAGGGSAANSKKLVEVPVLSFKAPNKVSGQTYLYEVEVVVTTKTANKAKVTASMEERAATIKDRVRTIISQSEPAKLGGGTEPGLETLRRQIKFQLDEIVGDHMIEEVLIPRCIPYRVDY